MDAYLSASLARDLEKARTALATGATLAAAADRIASGLTLAPSDSYSPLRTLFEQALTDVERVQAALRLDPVPSGIARPSSDPQQ